MEKVLDYFPPLVYACAYGSAVIKQVNCDVSVQNNNMVGSIKVL